MFTFLTYRQWGTLPRSVMDTLDERIQTQLAILADPTVPPILKYQEKQKYFRYKFLKLEQDLHHPSNTLCWLGNHQIAQLVLDCIRYRDGRDYHLVCCCIMPNHVHQVVYLPKEGKPLAQILKELKSFSARKANRILNRTGPFWQGECFDRQIREGGLEACVRYTMNNPVKAGLVPDWRDWPFSYLGENYVDMMDLAA